MHKKTKYLITAVILCLFFTLLYTQNVSFAEPPENGWTPYTPPPSSPGTTGTTTTTTTLPDTFYLCNECSMDYCVEAWRSEPCYTNCAACSKYTCDICSNNQCISKTFSTPCSNASNCSMGDCVGTTWCNVCENGQCIPRELGLGCTDRCTGQENCSGGGGGGDKYSCNTSTWTCEKDSSGAYSSSAACQSNCVKPSTTRYSCNTSTWTCEENSGGPYSSLSNCLINCIPSTTRYSCNTSTWTCEEDSSGAYSSLATCDANCKSSTTRYSCNTSTWTCEEDSSGAYSSLSTCDVNCIESPPPSLPKCDIIAFTINNKTNEDSNPLLVWVNSSLKGYVSTNAYCTECRLTSNDTWGNPPQVHTMTLANGYKAEEGFKILQSGIYSFELFCIGNPADPDDFDEDATSLQAVQAINLPWWREIIPVLTGFLGGI